MNQEIITRRLYKIDSDVNDYIDSCKKLEFKNNNSAKAMKWDWCLEHGAWYGSYVNNKIVSISGIHKFEDGYRGLFRGAQLETRPVKCLTRYQMQSYCISEQLPYQIEFAGGHALYITTNVSNDASGKMNRIHRSFSVMANGGMVDYIGDAEIFYTQQSIWRLNVDRYFEIRKRTLNGF